MNDKKNNKLTLQNVSLTFGAIPVLQNLSFTVNAGELVAMVGPSGCGKTTILNLLSGHIQPDAGQIQREGIIRTVYQKDGLFPWLTVSQNISMGLRSLNDPVQREKELQSLFELIHLEDFKGHYPHELSGGMRQRVEIARALAGDSDILFMDEPFSALDYQTRLRMRDELVRILKNRPRTVVFVTHDIEEAAQLADRVFVLSKRPATILQELEITAPKPRHLTNSEVTGATKEILECLGVLQESIS